MIMKAYIRDMVVTLICVFIFSGCGEPYDHKDIPSSIGILGTGIGEKTGCEISASLAPTEHADDSSMAGSVIMDASVPETEHTQELPTEENDVMEIYNDRNVISVAGVMTAQVSPLEFLTGNPVLYNCFRTDGWIFEWLITDLVCENPYTEEEAVLVASREGSPEEAQIIRVEAEGGYGTWVLTNKKFKYVDVNFDGIPDLLICSGHHGAQGFLAYYCFLQTEDGFGEAPTFTDIPNPGIDVENELILGQWRNSASSHSWAEYEYQEGAFVMVRHLCEEQDWKTNDDVWIYTINEEEAARSDTHSREEIDALFFNEDSEWNLSGDRWKEIFYNR